jgi:glucosamine 6-phosphate synthetase-like amidotransferase/phosphosugar isomerase protein
MTHFLRDILRQPDELERTIEYLCRPRLPALGAAADAIRNARHIYLTGIGSSWHAALNVGALFYQSARPVLHARCGGTAPVGHLPARCRHHNGHS